MRNFSWCDKTLSQQTHSPNPETKMQTSTKTTWEQFTVVGAFKRVIYQKILFNFSSFKCFHFLVSELQMSNNIICTVPVLSIHINIFFGVQPILHTFIMVLTFPNAHRLLQKRNNRQDRQMETLLGEWWEPLLWSSGSLGLTVGCLLLYCCNYFTM